MGICPKPRRLPAKEYLLLGEALFSLSLARLMLLLLPFRICVRTIRPQQPGRQGKDTKTARLIKGALHRANRLLPWKNTCLVQSFAARWMLQRRNIPSVLSIGVRHDEHKKLNAHAWLKAAGCEIVPKGGDFAPMKAY